MHAGRTPQSRGVQGFLHAQPAICLGSYTNEGNFKGSPHQGGRRHTCEGASAPEQHLSNASVRSYDSKPLLLLHTNIPVYRYSLTRETGTCSVIPARGDNSTLLFPNDECLYQSHGSHSYQRTATSSCERWIIISLDPCVTDIHHVLHSCLRVPPWQPRLLPITHKLTQDALGVKGGDNGCKPPHRQGQKLWGETSVPPVAIIRRVERLAWLVTCNRFTIPCPGATGREKVCQTDRLPMISPSSALKDGSGQRLLVDEEGNGSAMQALYRKPVCIRFDFESVGPIFTQGSLSVSHREVHLQFRCGSPEGQKWSLANSNTYCQASQQISGSADLILGSIFSAPRLLLFSRLWGHGPGNQSVEMTGSSVFDYVHPGDHAELAEQLGIKISPQGQQGQGATSEGEGSASTTPSSLPIPEHIETGTGDTKGGNCTKVGGGKDPFS
ncbi:Neuronal PAS domain-containing protein 3, partial [Branchiostoma belcheri]